MMHELSKGWRWMTRRERRGQSMVLVALMLPVLIGITGLALDAGNLYFQRRLLQRVADSAALVGAQKANFDPDSPRILGDGVSQAQANALDNLGSVGGTVEAYVPPTSGAYAGEDGFIEVTVSREVENPFMRLFGQNSTTVTARAVARAFVSQYGGPAILALSQEADAVTLSGCSGACVSGDVVSHGGVVGQGTATSVTGSVYALGGSIDDLGGPITATGGEYSSVQNPDASLIDVPDPTKLAGFAWPVWPVEFSIDPTGHAGHATYMHLEDTAPPDGELDEVIKDVSGNVNINDADGPITVGGGDYTSIRIDSNQDVEFNGIVHVSEDVYLDADATIRGDLFVGGKITITSGRTVDFNRRVNIHDTHASVTNECLLVDGTANFHSDVVVNCRTTVNGEAEFKPGIYHTVNVNGTVRFSSGMYDFISLVFGPGSHGRLTDPMSGGVLFRFFGPADRLDECVEMVNDGVPSEDFDVKCYDDPTTTDIRPNFLAVDVASDATLALRARNLGSNTWNDLVLYVPFNSINLGGAGVDITGSIYAPHAEKVSGVGGVNIGGASVTGQVVGGEISLGNGSSGSVTHAPTTSVAFGPVLVSTP